MPPPHLPTLLRVGHGEEGYKERQDNVLRMHTTKLAVSAVAKLERAVAATVARWEQKLNDA
jgi:hypothetical protein